MRPTIAAAGAALLLCLGSSSWAQSTLRIVVPYAPGGTADAMARMIAQPLGPLLGQTVVVENQPGAAGTLASGAVSRANPDGQTLVFTNTGPSAIAPAMSRKLAYHPVNDFTAVSLVARSPLVLVSSATLDVKDLKGLIAYAKANPGKVEYSSPGHGSFTHLATERFAQAAGIQLLHIPYKGQAPAVSAVVSGEVKMSLTSPSGVMFEMIRNGKLRLLGVSTREPTKLVPDGVPIAQTLPGYQTDFWFGLLAPAKTPPATVAKLHEAVQKALADPSIGKQFEAAGSEVFTGTSDQFQKLLAAEVTAWGEVVQQARIPPEN